MAGHSRLLALLVTSLVLTVATKEQNVTQKEALREHSRAPHHHPKEAPTTIPAPTDVQLVATCDHFIRAAWKYKGRKVDGFEVTLTEAVANITEKMTVPAAKRHVVFKIDPSRRNYTFTIRAYVYWQNRRYWSEEVGETVTSFGQAPDVNGFQAQVLTATSAKTTWKTVHSEDIHISVCPAARPDGNCVEYTTDGNLMVYVIDHLNPSTRYIVHASFSLALNGTVCKYDKSSQAITTPAQAPPSLQIRTISFSEKTVTVVVDGLSEQEFVQVAVNEEVRIYHCRIPKCIFTIRRLLPGRRYRLQMAACVDEDTCRARTPLEVITPDAPPSPLIKIVEARNTSIAISWTFTEANRTAIYYQVGYSSENKSGYHFTSDTFYEFTGLESNCTYTIYVEAFSVKGDGVRIGLPGYVTASTDTEKPLVPSDVPLPEVRKNPSLTVFSPDEGSARNVSFVTPSTILDSAQPSSDAPLQEISENPSLTVFNPEEASTKPRNLSFGTPSTILDSVEQRNNARSALPVLDLLFVLTTLLCSLDTFKSGNLASSIRDTRM